MKEPVSKLPKSSGGNEGKGNAKFYNTVSLTGEKLKKAERLVESQSSKILNFLKLHPDKKFTKCEVKKNLVMMGEIKENTHESTISARLTDLSKDGKVIKLPEMREGFYDKPNYLWQIMPEPTTPAGTQFNLF
jgi:hypothetical protein